MATENSNSTLEMGTSDQVLVASKRKKNITYGIGFGVMVLIIAVVVTVVVLLADNDGGVADPIITTEGPTSPITTTTTTTTTLAPPTTSPPVPTTTDAPTDPPQEPLDLESIINGLYSANSFNASWSSGNEILFRNFNGDLVQYNVDSRDTIILIANTSQTLQQSSRVTQLSSDGSQIILAYSVAPLFRYSFLARYAAYDVATGSERDIVPPGVQSSEVFLQNFVWGPRGTSLAFVYLNNIFYQSSLTAVPQQITTTGEINVIYHGVPDWVYEEEVFSSNNAMWFSADGQKLAYVTFDDTNVRVMPVPHYGVPGNINYQYTQHHQIRYPKPGTTNPTVTVTLRDLNSGSSNAYAAPSDLNEPILRTVQFTANNVIALMWTNRVQTTLRVVLCTLGQTACTQIYQYTETNGWIDNIPLLFNNAGDSFVTILPFAVDGVRYKQIVQVSRGTGTTWQSTGRTNTAHTVSEILHWSSNDIIWYRATRVNDPAEQHIYTVNSAREVACFTCEIRRLDGGQCLYNEATISSSGERITINCAGPDVPQVLIFDSSGNLIKEWDTNSELLSLVANKILPTTVRMSVPVAAGYPNADVQIQVPADYQHRTNLPLLVYVYGGPDTSLVTKQWSIDWGSYLVSRWNVAVAHIDGRGAGNRGVNNLFALNRKLGTVEIEDQISVTKYLQEKLSYVDANRTCIWGWSYGGYAASLALARGGDVFRCAAAVAPVVDWKFYDTIYTERYMDLPQNNVEGYAVSSLLVNDVVDSYKSKSYFLVHGTADDNVHYQHAMLISRLLQRRDIYFTQMSYTDEDHDLIGVRPHLYHGLEKFLRENMF
ncbi:venom dipeptidyl peptidase 4-like isoform X1 [Bombyx mandarina]|uniref:Venom dipeptidyl peptidase 4 n=2 Tax=Bombyx mandarina TaxID=7092 RepID=A0A6J2JJF7_BOMMA|nr:venom dipeptidyl peptidase 4-like isoform X1 [Bombyx mandarina]